MVRNVRTVKNPKVAFLSFRIVEETIKRAFLNSQI